MLAHWLFLNHNDQGGDIKISDNITCRQDARWGIIWSTSGSERTVGTWRGLWSICSRTRSWDGCKLSDVLDKFQTNSREDLDLPGHSRWVRSQCCVGCQTQDTPRLTLHWAKLFLVWTEFGQFLFIFPPQEENTSREWLGSLSKQISQREVIEERYQIQPK